MIEILITPGRWQYTKVQMLQTTHAQIETVSVLGFGGEVANGLSSFSDFREVGGHFFIHTYCSIFTLSMIWIVYL